MKTLIFLIFSLVFTTASSQTSYFQPSSNYFLHSNQTLQNRGKIIVGDYLLNYSQHKFQVYNDSNRNTSIMFGANKKRLEFAFVSSAGSYAPHSEPGDLVIRRMGNHNTIFHMPNNNMDHYNLDSPDANGIWFFKFSDNVNRNSLVIYNNAKVTMGTRNFDNEDYRLYVKNGIKTEKIKVEIANDNGWADYVFEDDYELLPLKDLAIFIKENKHLPNIPSSEEVVENGGVELKEMNVKLLEKVEELTLYVIKQQEEIEELKKQVKDIVEQKEQVEEMEEHRN